MAIVVNYGPIAGALSLASKAGVGQGFNIQANRDLQALQVQNQMQSEIDRTNANSMQNALAYDQLNSQNQQHQQAMAQQSAMQNAQQQMQMQQFDFNKQTTAANQQMQTDQFSEKQREFDEQQMTREQQAQELSKLRDAQTQKLQNPPTNDTAPIQANGQALRSLDQQAAQTQRQIQQLTTALAKASDPYTGDKGQAAALQQQISGLKFSLDGIDPATGKKSQPGLNDKRDQLRGVLQNFGAKLKPSAVIQQSPVNPMMMDFINDPDSEGMQNPDDPLYQVNNQTMPVSYQQQGGGQPPQGGAPAQQGSKGQATPAMIAQLGQMVAQKLGAQSMSDPAVRQTVRQLLIQEGYSIPTIQ